MEAVTLCYGVQDLGASACAQLVVVDDVAQDGVRDGVGQREADTEAETDGEECRGTRVEGDDAAQRKGARAIHMPCTCRAHAVHIPCTYRAHTVHMPSRASSMCVHTCRAPGVHTCCRAPGRRAHATCGQQVCTCYARAMHVLCTCLLSRKTAESAASRPVRVVLRPTRWLRMSCRGIETKPPTSATTDVQR